MISCYVEAGFSCQGAGRELGWPSVLNPQEEGETCKSSKLERHHRGTEETLQRTHLSVVGMCPNTGLPQNLAVQRFHLAKKCHTVPFLHGMWHIHSRPRESSHKMFRKKASFLRHKMTWHETQDICKNVSHFGNHLSCVDD